MIAHLDFETRSRADLKAVGASRYGCDPSTEVLMAGVSVDDSDAVLLWIAPQFWVPDTLYGFNCSGQVRPHVFIPPASQIEENLRVEALLTQADLIYAHNAPFEIAIAWGTRFFSPRIEQWRCTMAMARKAGLPPSLGQCAAALGLPEQKDTEGKALIRFFCIPRKDGKFNEPRDFPEKWTKFCNYCRQDVRTEKAIHKKLKAFELQGEPLETFQFDLRMNQRGVPVNVPALKNAQRIIESVQEDVTKKFQALTGLNPTQREAVRQFVGLPDMQGETIEAILKAPVNNPLHVRRNEALALYQKVSYAAVKKVATMLDWACPDGRMRGVFKYYGAGTGRWTAGGPQVQNAKKATPEMRPMTKAVYDYIQKGPTAEGIDLVYGEPLEVLSSCIRHFIHQPGVEMLDGDFASVEARVLCWLAGQEDALKEYRDGLDRYKLMAATIYDVDVSRVTSDQREVGKRAILGLGFGMGAEKFVSSCKEQYQLDVPMELAEKAKTSFRQKHDKITKYWYFLDSQAREVIRNPGRQCGPFRAVSAAGVPYLLAKLPSGRSLAYPRPQIDKRPPTREEMVRMQAGFDFAPERFLEVTYYGQLFGSTQWGRIKLYGGKLAENLTQAVAADFMAHGAKTAEARGMPPFALIHDQALALRDKGQTPEEFAAALGDLPAWAKGFPMKVECRICEYYSK